MWHRMSCGEFGPPFLRRGAIKFIILDLLKDKPKHGYEIIKDMEAKGGGLYSPSPGSVYPTLQMMEELGYVMSRQDGNKKVYEITPEGRKYLEENRDAVEDVPDAADLPFAPFFEPEARSALEEMHKLVITLVRAARTRKLHRAEQFREVRDVLTRARKDIDGVLSK